MRLMRHQQQHYVCKDLNEYTEMCRECVRNTLYSSFIKNQKLKIKMNKYFSLYNFAALIARAKQRQSIEWPNEQVKSANKNLNTYGP